MKKFNEESEQPEKVVEREVKSVMISDGVYKYVYADTGEDVDK